MNKKAVVMILGVVFTFLMIFTYAAPKENSNLENNTQNNKESNSSVNNIGSSNDLVNSILENMSKEQLEELELLFEEYQRGNISLQEVIEKINN